MRRRPSERHRLFAFLYELQRFWEPVGIVRHRRAIARGVVAPALEVGIGTGFSLPHYAQPPVAACDLSLAMLKRARERARRLGANTAFVCARAEALPFRDAAFRTVVSELVMCSVQSPHDAARQIRRVLTSDGHYRFVEHGIARRRLLARLQRALAPAWARVCAGCRLDRDPLAPLASAGLEPERVRHCSGGTVVRATYAPEHHEHPAPVGPPA